jgi:hypothetical protein
MGVKTKTTLVRSKKAGELIEKQIKSPEMLVTLIQKEKYIFYNFGCILGQNKGKDYYIG